MRECDTCGALSKPLVDQVIFLHDFRQMLVYWQNTVRLICYEASGTSLSGDYWSGVGGRNGPQGFSGIRGGGGSYDMTVLNAAENEQRKLPIDHDFSFHKVTMESYALKHGLYRRQQGIGNQARNRGSGIGQPL